MKAILASSVLLISFSAFAASDTSALKAKAAEFVPSSTFLAEDGDEFQFQTAKGTIVEVELNRDGSIDEASGDAALTGDVFVPGGSLLSLSAAVESLKKSGKTTQGDWSFEKSTLNGWVYEFEGVEGGKKMEYVIDATAGKLIKAKRD